MSNGLYANIMDAIDELSVESVRGEGAVAHRVVYRDRTSYVKRSP